MSRKDASAVKRKEPSAKLAANRKNAARSTGPKTEVGKKRSRWNAVKNGILSSAVIISSDNSLEKEEDFKQLLDSMLLDYKPVGTIEHMLIERIATCYWRLRRVLTAEVGEIQKKLDYAAERQQERRRHAAYSSTLSRDQGTFVSYRFSTEGLHCLLGNLKPARAEYERDGCLSETKGAAIKAIFKGTDVGQMLGHFLETPNKKKTVIAFMDWVIETHEQLKRAYEKFDAAYDQAKVKSLCIPTQQSSERLARYETTIERQLYKAIDQLFELQSVRLFGSKG